MSNKIIKYEVVSLELGYHFTSSDITEKDFSNLINNKINEGYQPYGELITSVESSGSFLGNSSTTRLSQVMVKYES